MSEKKHDEQEVAEMSAGDQRELMRLKIMREKLELEHLSMTVENEKARRDQIAMSHKTQQMSLDDYNRQVRMQQEICKHRKGGKNLEGILRGHDSNYSVGHHTYPWDPNPAVHCTRCTREWRMPPQSLRKKNKKEYNRLLAEYRTALEWPTDNEPTGSVMFQFTRVGKGAIELPA